MIIEEDDYLAHYGVLRRSGRYPWGSGQEDAAPHPWSLGETQSIRNATFLQVVEDLKRQGLTESQICLATGIVNKKGEPSTTTLRALKAIAKNEQKQAEITRAQQLKDKQYSNVAIGLKMGRNESYVRTLLAPGAKAKADILLTTADMLKEEVASKRFVDIGAGNESRVGVSTTQLSVAVAVLKEEGYEVHTVPVPQQGTRKQTNTKVLCPPGTTWGELAKNKDKIALVGQYTDNGGQSYDKIYPPLSISPKRVAVRYGPDGGDQADGVIYVREGVKDVSLGKARYAQVRIKVGDNHYLKGMAMYKDDLPDGVDLVFNTNKKDTGNKLDAMKPVKTISKTDLTPDTDNPFGSMIKRQITEKNTDGTHKKVTSVMNIVHEEGDWNEWSRNLSAQMLSKQSRTLAREQLDLTYSRRKAEYDEISKLTNPTIKRELLAKFADSTEAAAVHMKAAQLPRQRTQVILPIEDMAPTQVYAPNFKQGERVVLIRFPHGGKFEIPELEVNNTNPKAKKLLGQASDAIGIHPSVAERLSGADFDGDTVLVIPNNSGKVHSSPALEALKDFNPKTAYPKYPGMKVMSNTQTEMGMISNLITDMTIRGASTDKIARAVKHSMVVIDAEKHELNYKQSYLDNGIQALKREFQGTDSGTGRSGGASTLISRAGARIDVPDRKPRPAALGGPVDKATGKLVFVETGKTHWKTGKPLTTQSKKLAEVEDANTLSSGTPIERLYADHSNRLKELAAQARKESVNAPRLVYSPSANKAYKDQVRSLDAQLKVALSNAPLERQAQIVAASIIKLKRDQNPHMDDSDRKKMEAQSLNEARVRVGAKKHQVVIKPDEWEAIQAGAISDSKLLAIMQNTDIENLRQLATPKSRTLMTPAKRDRAARMIADGFERAEVADALGVSLTTLDLSLNPIENDD